MGRKKKVMDGDGELTDDAVAELLPGAVGEDLERQADAIVGAGVQHVAETAQKRIALNKATISARKRATLSLANLLVGLQPAVPGESGEGGESDDRETLIRRYFAEIFGGGLDDEVAHGVEVLLLRKYPNPMPPELEYLPADAFGKIADWRILDFREKFLTGDDFWAYVRHRFGGGCYRAHLRTIRELGQRFAGHSCFRDIDGPPKWPGCVPPEPAAPKEDEADLRRAQSEYERELEMARLRAEYAPAPAEPRDPLDDAARTIQLARDMNSAGNPNEALLQALLKTVEQRAAAAPGTTAVGGSGGALDAALAEVVLSKEKRRILAEVNGPAQKPLLEQIQDFAESPLGLMLVGAVKSGVVQAKTWVEELLAARADAAEDWKVIFAQSVPAAIKEASQTARAIMERRADRRGGEALPETPPALEFEHEWRRRRAALEASTREAAAYRRPEPASEPAPAPPPSLREAMLRLLAVEAPAGHDHAQWGVRAIGQGLAREDVARLSVFCAELTPESFDRAAAALDATDDQRALLAAFYVEWRALCAAGSFMERGARDEAVAALLAAPAPQAAAQ